MKVVITGGTGLIGNALAKSLAADHHQVLILSRDPKRRSSPAPGIEIVRWDGKTAGDWIEQTEGAEAIINLAGASIDQRWTDSHKKLIVDSRKEAGQAVVAGIKSMAQKPEVVIQASAVGYYGPRDDTEITEEAPAGNDFLAEVCKVWEASTEDVETLGVRRCVIRTGIVLSTKGGAMARLLPIFRMFAGGPVGSGKQYMSWIHIGDQVDAIRFLIENKNAKGAFNLTAPNPVTNREFVKALGSALGRPSLIPAPGFSLKIMFGEMSTVVLDGQRVMPQKLQHLNYNFRFIDPENAIRNLLYSGIEG
jgi:hypothetical protein